MSESNFEHQQGSWLSTLTTSTSQSLLNTDTDTDKRKWDALEEIPESIIKHFHNGDGTTVSNDSNDYLSQIGKQLTDDDLANSDLSPSKIRQKRKEQNRVAQRAFRERKERYVKELELKIKQLEEDRINETKQLKEENQALLQKVRSMETEIYTLKGAEQAFKISIQKLREAGVQLPADTPITATSILTPPASTVSLSHKGNDVAFSPSDQSSSSTSAQQQQGQHQHERQWRSTSPPFTGSSPYSTSSASLTPSSPHSTQYDQLLSTSDRLIYVDETIDTKNQHHHSEISHPLEHMPYSELEPDMGFAKSETERFHHKPDPILQEGVKTIPYSQLWEKVQEHPKFEMFDMDLLCEDLRKKARCSGSGPVILEEDFIKVLQKYDDN